MRHLKSNHNMVQQICRASMALKWVITAEVEVKTPPTSSIYKTLKKLKSLVAVVVDS